MSSIKIFSHLKYSYKYGLRCCTSVLARQRTLQGLSCITLQLSVFYTGAKGFPAEISSRPTVTSNGTERGPSCPLLSLLEPTGLDTDPPPSKLSRHFSSTDELTWGEGAE